MFWCLLEGESKSSYVGSELPQIQCCSWAFLAWKVKVHWSKVSHSVVSDSLWPQGLYSPWNSPGQNTGVGSLSLLQGIFPAQGSNPGLPHYRQILYQLIYKGSPRILEWLVYPFSSVSSQPWNWTRVSCIADGFFTNWAMREAPQNMFIFIIFMLFCEGIYMDLR